MAQMFLTIGSKDFLTKIIKENNLDDVIPLSSDDGKTALLSGYQLKDTKNPLVFDVKESFIENAIKPMNFIYTYLTADEKTIEIITKLINISKNDFQKTGVIDLGLIQETTDLKRYVLVSSWKDFNDLQHFKTSPLLKKVTDNFTNSFNVIYTRGLD